MALQTVTVQVRVSGTPIPGASVLLRDAQGGVVAGSVTDSVTGNATFLLMSAGAYTARVEKAGYSFSDTALTVADTGVSQSFTVAGTSLGLTSPTPPSRCVVWGVLLLQPGENVPQVWVSNWSLPLRGTGGSQVHPESLRMVHREVLVRVGTDGRWEISVPMGSMLRVRIPVTGFQKTILVPQQASASILDVHQFPEHTYQGLSGDTMITSSISGSGR